MTLKGHHIRDVLTGMRSFPKVIYYDHTTLIARRFNSSAWELLASMNPFPLDDLEYRNTECPSFFWRSSSYQTLLSVSVLSRAFLFGLNKVEVNGLPRFLDLIKSRADYKTRRKGLVTVSNHISVLDDPLIWGVLPLSFAAFHGYMNHRWSFGSHDICFKGPWLQRFPHFFSLGQTLPTVRMAHEPGAGGLFQPTMTEAIRMLSKITSKNTSYNPFYSSLRHSNPDSHAPSWPRDCIDPFSDISPPPAYPSSNHDTRLYLAPSRYACNSYSWIHIFPEGMIHQAPDQTMRYFKWGVARLILEPPECPDVVPIFIEGTEKIMHESRSFPRPLPRIGKKVSVTFGNKVDTEAVFGDLRRRWRELADREMAHHIKPQSLETRELIKEKMLGLVHPESLLYGPEAVELRIECTRRVRDEVLKVRRSRGLPDEDPKCGLIETWMREGPNREGRMDDGSWIKDT